MVEQKIKLFEGKEIPVDIYRADSKKNACIIIHGMQEHKGRYEGFAKFLQRNGISCFVPELRGHGEFWGKGSEGYEPGDMVTRITEDIIELFKLVKKEYSGNVFIFGHSFGSFITQRLISLGVPADKFVLCGSSYTCTFEMKMGYIISKLACGFKKEKNTAKLIESMSFKSYGKKFENGNWLTRDEEVFNYYKQNEYCGHPFPYNFYRYFFKSNLGVYKNLEGYDKSHEIFIISGDKDPVSKNGRLALRLYGEYKKYGLPATIKLYPNARHELLNEINKEEVYSDILQFFDGE